jgi:hypothetical protein
MHPSPTLALRSEQSRFVLALAAAIAVLPGCIIIDVSDEDFGVFGDDEGFFDDDFDDYDDNGAVESARVRGDIGPSRGIDSDGRVSAWVGDGNINAEVEGTDVSGAAILSIVDIYGLELVVGASTREVSVTGCSGNTGFEDEYDYDDYTDDAEAVVVDCGCDEAGVVDVVIQSTFADNNGYGVQSHTTTLRIVQ